METKPKVACWLALVAMVISGVLAHRDSVIRFHQDTKSHPQQIAFKPGHKDRGYVKNCGKYLCVYHVERVFVGSIRFWTIVSKSLCYACIQERVLIV